MNLTRLSTASLGCIVEALNGARADLQPGIDQVRQWSLVILQARASGRLGGSFAWQADETLRRAGYDALADAARAGKLPLLAEDYLRNEPYCG